MRDTKQKPSHPWHEKQQGGGRARRFQRWLAESRHKEWQLIQSGGQAPGGEDHYPESFLAPPDKANPNGR